MLETWWYQVIVNRSNIHQVLPYRGWFVEDLEAMKFYPIPDAAVAGRMHEVNIDIRRDLQEIFDKRK